MPGDGYQLDPTANWGSTRRTDFAFAQFGGKNSPWMAALMGTRCGIAIRYRIGSAPFGGVARAARYMLSRSIQNERTAMGPPRVVVSPPAQGLFSVWRKRGRPATKYQRFGGMKGARYRSRRSEALLYCPRARTNPLEKGVARFPGRLAGMGKGSLKACSIRARSGRTGQNPGFWLRGAPRPGRALRSLRVAKVDQGRVQKPFDLR